MVSDQVSWSLVHWLVFSSLVAIVLFLDLLVFQRKDKEQRFLASLGWTIFWCSVAAGFAGLVWYWSSRELALLFATGYVVEWSLSMDNVFVFALIFRFFHVAPEFQHRVLFWGILGAVVMRLAFIMAGVGLIRNFGWVMWVFGAFLVYSGVKLLFHDNTQIDPDRNILVRIGRKLLPISRGPHHGHFFVRENGKWMATSLFLVLLVVESTDVVFAVDSIPAIFGITTDPFIVFTSNVFAIMGLRSLYFLLAGMIRLFRFLHYGLSAILVFIGLKMIVEYWWEHTGNGTLVTPVASLGVVMILLIGSVAASLLFPDKGKKSEL